MGNTHEMRIIDEGIAAGPSKEVAARTTTIKPSLLLVEDKIHSLYEIKNRFGSKIITAVSCLKIA